MTGILATSLRDEDTNFKATSSRDEITNKVFFFNTKYQDEVENFMTILGYGCTEYSLSLGELKETEK